MSYQDRRKIFPWALLLATIIYMVKPIGGGWIFMAVLLIGALDDTWQIRIKRRDRERQEARPRYTRGWTP